MAENIVLNDVTTFTNDTSAVNTVNGNNDTITSAFADVLSRSGNSPNQMLSALDMNSNQIFNLPPPSTINSPARLVDVASNPTIVVPGTGTSGHTVPFLDGNNTWSGTNAFNAATTLAAATTVSGVATFSTNPVFNAGGISGVSIANNGIGNAQIRQGSARTVVGVTGNATANVADIQGTTRQVLAVNTAGTGLSFAQPQGDQLLGTTTNDNATAGNVGEFVSSTVNSGSAVSLTTNVAANITSISLTAGDWDVFIDAYFSFAGTTSVTNMQTSISTISATISQTPGNWGVVQQAASVPTAANPTNLGAGPVRLSLSGTTTVFLVVQATFTVAATSAYGIISARRVR